MIEGKITNVLDGVDIFRRAHVFTIETSVPMVPDMSLRDARHLANTIKLDGPVRILTADDVVLSEATNQELMAELSRRLQHA